MSQGANQNQSNNEALYDLFLKGLKTPNEAPTSGIQSLLHHLRKPSSDSADVSVKYLESPDSVAVHSITGDYEIREFVNKIYEPVKRLKVSGFDYDEKTLKMWLLNEETHGSFKLFGVVGMLGVGKTTLCRMILDEEEVKQRYFPRLFTTMPETESMEKVVGTMLEQLGVEEETIESITKDHQLPGLLYALHLQLEGKKFLIVLDDVKQEGNYYEDLARSLVNGHGFFPKGDGGAVILNGRNEKAIQEIVGERNVHRLKLLSDPEDCWKIYRAAALGEDGEHDYPRIVVNPSKEVKEELKKKCGGLPLAARIMGELKRREHFQKEIQKSKNKKASGGEGTSNDQSSENVEATKGSGPENHI